MSGHRIFAALYDRLMTHAERTFMRESRAEIVGGARGRVLEIGAGTGASFAWYAAGVERIVATEPDRFMRRRAVARAQGAPRPTALVGAEAERLPFAAGTFDAVVCTLVLCSVRDPAASLGEIRRVLRPGGELRFHEHVRSTSRVAAALQSAVAPAWGALLAGCRPDRDTLGAIARAGFTLRALARSTPLPPIPPLAAVRPHARGVAVRT